MSGLFFDTLNCEKQNINPLQPTKHKIQPFQNEGILELGIDEAGRGCLFGRLYVAGVILPNNIEELCDEEDIIIKDSKKMTKNNKERARIFIENNAIDYSIVYKESQEIDSLNILQATLAGMHDVVNGIVIKPEKILVDGDKFKKYVDSDGVHIPHECIVEGIINLCLYQQHPFLQKLIKINILKIWLLKILNWKNTDFLEIAVMELLFI